MGSKPQDKLSQEISKYQASKGLVGLGAIILEHGQVQAIAVAGMREAQSNMLIKPDDKWHIGSLTKPITASMIARLVEKQSVNWNTSIQDVFGSFALLHEDWKCVTISDLLTHTAGVAPNFPTLVHLKNPAEGPERTAQRKKAVLNLLKKPLAYAPKTKHLYSNAGYTIVGVIVETITNCSWEELIRKNVFQPLGLNSAGFGPPKDSGSSIEQPRGHRKRIFSRQKVSVGTNADNTSIIGPAGTIHMSLADLATFTHEHLLGHQGKGTLLNSDSYHILHKPVLEDYACGWIIEENSPIWHNGSNTMWYAYTAFEPKSGRVICLTANDPDIATCEHIAKDLVDNMLIN